MPKSNNTRIANAVKKYLGNTCNYCDEDKKIQIHHILPTNRGGRDEIANFELVCQSCHNKLHDQIRKIMPIKRNGYIMDCEKCGSVMYRKIKGNYKYCIRCRQKLSREKYKIKNI